MGTKKIIHKVGRYNDLPENQLQSEVKLNLNQKLVRMHSFEHGTPLGVNWGSNCEKYV